MFFSKSQSISGFEGETLSFSRHKLIPHSKEKLCGFISFSLRPQ